MTYELDQPKLSIIAEIAGNKDTILPTAPGHRWQRLCAFIFGERITVEDQYSREIVRRWRGKYYVSGFMFKKMANH